MMLMAVNYRFTILFDRIKIHYLFFLDVVVVGDLTAWFKRDIE